MFKSQFCHLYKVSMSQFLHFKMAIIMHSRIVMKIKNKVLRMVLGRSQVFAVILRVVDFNHCNFAAGKT